MKKYRVEVREIWIQDVIVEANSPLEAARLVKNGEGHYDDNAFYFSHTMDDYADEMYVTEEDEDQESDTSRSDSI